MMNVQPSKASIQTFLTTHTSQPPQQLQQPQQPQPQQANPADERPLTGTGAYNYKDPFNMGADYEDDKD